MDMTTTNNNGIFCIWGESNDYVDCVPVADDYTSEDGVTTGLCEVHADAIHDDPTVDADERVGLLRERFVYDRA